VGAAQIGEFIGAIIATILLKCRGELVAIIAESIRAAMTETYSEHRADETTRRTLRERVGNSHARGVE
jgi:hypothetical protein